MDAKLFMLMYRTAAERKWLRTLVKGVAGLSKSFFFIVYGVGALWLFTEKSRGLIAFIAIPFLVLCYNSFLRKLIGRTRPFVRFGLEPMLSHEANGSCPSNHAASSVVIALAFWLISPYISCFLLVMALFTGLSRVFAGVHYPLDVLIGWLIGGITGVLGFIIL